MGVAPPSRAALLYGILQNMYVKRFSLPWLQHALAIACAGPFCSDAHAIGSSVTARWKDHDDHHTHFARTDHGTSPTGCSGLQRPVEDVLRDLLAAVLPTMHDVPDDMQAELMRMTWLDSQELWRIAREQRSAAAQAQLQ